MNNPTEIAASKQKIFPNIDGVTVFIAEPNQNKISL
jgi:hypothetical protein